MEGFSHRSLWDHFYFYFRSIRRIIFYSLIKPSINEKGEKEIEPITTSQALQIAGRAGRFSSKFKEGEVTTMNREDLNLLREILNRPVDPIRVRCNMLITSSLWWRTVNPSFTYLPDSCLRQLKTDTREENFAPWKSCWESPTLLLWRVTDSAWSENGMQVTDPD